MRTVVDLPFVPVTATTGMRAGRLSGNSMSMTGLATFRARPSEGSRCILNPGAALISTMPPPVSVTGRVMSGARKSMPAISRPTTAAARRAIIALTGWMTSVRSIAEPPVDRLAVSLRRTIRPGSGVLSSVSPSAVRRSRS